MGSAGRGVSQVDLIEDLQRLGSKTTQTISRNYYRANGRYNEREWQRHFSTFSAFLSAAGLNPPSTSSTPGTETNELTGNTWTITLPKTRIKTVQELLEHANVDQTLWEIERFVCNAWEMGAVIGDGEKKRIITEPLFQVKATLKKKPGMEAARQEIERLKQEAKHHAPQPTLYFHKGLTSGNVLEINIPDAHFGKLAWGKETGWENYDTVIAEQTFLRAVETLIQRTSAYTFDEVLFVVGNDLLNSDDLEGRTTKGTFVSTDGRYQKTFSVVRRTITQAIERLRQIAPVTVAMVSGNHDDLSVWHLGDSLECYFHNYEDVVIDNAPKSRKYYRYGDVMLMLTHGDKGRRTDYPLLMAAEEREMWGATKFRECHTGHTHMTKTDEQHGVRVRVLPALCPPDAWHAENGFVGNQRNAEAYVWNRTEGLIAQVFHNEDALTPIETKRMVA